MRSLLMQSQIGNLYVEPAGSSLACKQQEATRGDFLGVMSPRLHHVLLVRKIGIDYDILDWPGLLWTT